MRTIISEKRLRAMLEQMMLKESAFEAALERVLIPSINWERFANSNKFTLSGPGSQNFIRMILDEVEVSSPRIGDIFEEMITSDQGSQIQQFLLNNTDPGNLGSFVFNSNEYDNNSAFSDVVLGAANSDPSIFPTTQDMSYNLVSNNLHEFKIKPYLVSAKASFSSAGGSFLSSAYGNSNIHIHTAAVMCAYIVSRYISSNNIAIEDNDDVNVYVNLGGISLVPTVSLQNNDLEALGVAIYQDTLPLENRPNELQTQKTLSIQGYSSYVVAKDVLITLKGADINKYAKFIDASGTAKNRINQILDKAGEEDILSLIIDNATDQGAGLINQQKLAIIRAFPFIQTLLQQAYNNISTVHVPMETVTSLVNIISNQIAGEKKRIVQSSIEQHLSNLNMQDILEYYDFVFDHQKQIPIFNSELSESTSIQLHPIHKLKKKYLQKVTLKGQAELSYEAFEENVMARVLETLPDVKLELNIDIPNIKSISSETGLKHTLERMEVLSRIVDILTLYAQGQPLPERLQTTTSAPVDFIVDFGKLETLSGGSISKEFVTAVVRKLAQRYFTANDQNVRSLVSAMFNQTEHPNGLTATGAIKASVKKSNEPRPNFNRVFDAANKNGKVNSKSIQELLVDLLSHGFQSQEILFKGYVNADLNTGHNERSAIREVRSLLHDITVWFKTSFFKLDKSKILSVIDAVRTAFQEAVDASDQEDNSLSEIFGKNNQRTKLIQKYFKDLISAITMGDKSSIESLSLDIENFPTSEKFLEKLKKTLQDLLEKLKILESETLVMERKLYESIILDILKIAKKKSKNNFKINESSQSSNADKIAKMLVSLETDQVEQAVSFGEALDLLEPMFNPSGKFSAYSVYGPSSSRRYDEMFMLGLSSEMALALEKAYDEKFGPGSFRKALPRQSHIINYLPGPGYKFKHPAFYPNNQLAHMTKGSPLPAGEQNNLSLGVLIRTKTTALYMGGLRYDR